VQTRTLTTCSIVVALGAGTLGALSLVAPTAGADVHGDPAHGLTVRTVLDGAALSHRFTPVGTTGTSAGPLTNPDDVTHFGSTLFVGFQNGVGPQGQPNTDGNQDSTVVAFTPNGHVTGQWDVRGKADGVTADPTLGAVIVTVNEDANSALYVVRPGWGGHSGSVTRYTYNEPLPHYGGTDAITVYQGRLIISASAPGTTGAPAPQPGYPAVYSVSLDQTTAVATVTPLFDDEDSATVANVRSTLGHTVQLGLTDPDSNEAVPLLAPRFGGDFMLTSQGDLQQIYLPGAATASQRLSVLDLSQSVDDTAWAVGPGALFASDSTADSVDVITGPFGALPVVAATPCGSNSAPSTCPAPGFPTNFLGTLDPWTGQIEPLTLHGVPFTPQGGLTWLSALPW
jgi:hypothetical protein